MSVRLDRPEPHIALITVDNPARRNALGPQEFVQLAQCWDRLEDDETVRCVVITGAGDKAFCSGASLDADFSAIEALDDLIDRALRKTRYFPRPVVAAVNGHCVAGGFELMLSTDIRVLSQDAKLGLPEVHWGIVPSGGGAMKLIDQIGHARAMQLMLTADLIGADEALRFGLVNRVLPQSEVLGAAFDLARRIAGNSPMAVARTKQAALARRAAQWQAGEADERALVATMRGTEQERIGRRAFLDKQAPIY